LLNGTLSIIPDHPITLHTTYRVTMVGHQLLDFGYRAKINMYINPGSFL